MNPVFHSKRLTPAPSTTYFQNYCQSRGFTLYIYHYIYRVDKAAAHTLYLQLATYTQCSVIGCILSIFARERRRRAAQRPKNFRRVQYGDPLNTSAATILVRESCLARTHVHFAGRAPPPSSPTTSRQAAGGR